jgi:hypothetical protein
MYNYMIVYTNGLQCTPGLLRGKGIKIGACFDNVETLAINSPSSSHPLLWNH